MTKRILLLLLLLLPFLSFAQNLSVSGRLSDAADGGPLVYAEVLLSPLRDSVNVRRGLSDTAGQYRFEDLAPGGYLLRIQTQGYTAVRRQLTVAADVREDVALRATGDLLTGVTVRGQQIRGEQNGDTSSFRADAYKTNPDATAEDLVRRMPGVTSDGTGLKVNGEEVRRVMVDGKPFFGDDPNASLKNLPAEIVDRVEIYDNMSDQARFSGFNDGNQEKTINLVTRRGKNEGVFGKVYAGYGTDNRYQAGLTLNYFQGARRISLLGLSNNINQQNFSIADVMSVMGNSGGQGGGPGGPGGPGGGGGNSGGGPRSGSGGPSNFGGPGGLLTGQQNGITRTHSIGLNYSDEWGKKVKVSGSYFFNNTDNLAESSLRRNYYTDTTLSYEQTSTASTQNTNHRANLRLEYNIDSANTITITPRLTMQGNRSSSALQAVTLQDTTLLNNSSTNQRTGNSGYSFTNNLLYQHRFRKRGRTVSLNLGQVLSARDGSGSYLSNTFYAADASTVTLDQRYTNDNSSATYNASLSYTEPLGKYSQLQLNYSPSYNTSQAEKLTSGYNSLLGGYTDLDTTLSNRYSSNYTTHRGGVGYRYNRDKITFNAGVDAQQSVLRGEQVFPVAFTTARRFSSILPNAFFNYRIAQGQNLMIHYRSSNNAPTVTQLQSVPDVSNPLQVSLGNPNLDQTWENMVFFRYGKTNKASQRNFFLSGAANYTADYITNATSIIRRDTVIDGGYVLNSGAQLTRPVNLDNYYSLRANGVYSLPVKSLKSNLNLNGGLSFAHTPALINEVLNYSNNLTANAGLYLSSNISTKVDFSLSYNGSYTVVKNTVSTASDNSYFNGNATLRGNFILPSNIVLNTDITHTLYSGLTESFNQSFLLWNAYVGYKFLKDRSLEARISVFDILNQNRSISRTFTEAYAQDTRTRVLQRYGMLTLTYTLRHFKKGSTQPESRLPSDMPPPPREGMMPPGGMMPPPPPGG